MKVSALRSGWHGITGHEYRRVSCQLRFPGGGTVPRLRTRPWRGAGYRPWTTGPARWETSGVRAGARAMSGAAGTQDREQAAPDCRNVEDVMPGLMWLLAADEVGLAGQRIALGLAVQVSDSGLG